MIEKESTQIEEGVEETRNKSRHIVKWILVVVLVVCGLFSWRDIVFEIGYQLERGKFERKLSRYFDDLPDGAPLLPLNIDGWTLAAVCGGCGTLMNSPPESVCSLQARGRLNAWQQRRLERRNPSGDFWEFYNGCQAPMLLNAGERFPWFDIPKLPDSNEIYLYANPPRPSQKQCVYKYKSDLLPSVEKYRMVVSDCVAAN